ncbi:serine/arginine-rich splicing factor 2-like [Camellia sinensis]|uniref:serine/arginine-rich splicing factor 2-like n=1 Tax=Camellia sinensis TaxID=4442 RepID=UPI001035C4F4|nr:serine/arginine-rich splicing factor 2-like [Camellia sinensis]
MEDGGWNPVIRRRRVANQYSRSVEYGVYTLFVDDIPSSMTPEGLYMLFNNFGVVKDVFIPSKRRKSTGSRFGFVRYDCKVAVEMAVMKGDGLWCDNKALKVKKAEFKKGEFKQHTMTNRGDGPMTQRPQKSFGHRRMDVSGRRSFAEVVQSGGRNEKMKMVVQAFEVGNGWLYDSVIVRLKSFFFLR